VSRAADNRIYSVKLCRGLDTEHYDLVFEETCLRLIYLGEYWEKTRPITGLQKSMDLHIYRIRKRKQRVSSQGRCIPYSEIEEYELTRPRLLRKRRRMAGRTVVEEETIPPRLRLRLRGGERLVIELHPRVYELAKTLVKTYLAKKARGAVKRTR